MNFIKNAHLPEKDVSLCIAGDGISPFKSELLKLGIKIIETDKNHNISEGISNHADLVFNYLGNGLIFTDLTQNRIAKSLKEQGFACNYISEKVYGEYPNDCFLNCVVSDKFILCNKRCTSKSILDYAEKNNKHIIDVNQGYVKCSVCVVSNNAFITDDESIYKALASEKYDVLLIKKGSIRLNGYDYGFIGGCSGKISEKNIAFTGDIRRHSCYDNIKAFAKNYSVDLISLSNDALVDIGSLIPIAEKE